MELFEDDETPGNAPEFTVSELSGAVKRTIEGAFDHVRVRGEVGRVTRPRSGHVYLDLKDDRAVLSGVIWRGVADRLETFPEEGMEVIASGRLTTFPGQSRYQIVIDDVRPAGLGALMAMLEKRRAALAAEGLFDSARKRKLPFLPEVIGVVTSPTGAVIRDILHRLRDRFPRKVLIWPVAVQGKGSAEAVARAIAGFNALTPGGALPRPDLLIVARGGGSVEDLWGFNEEIVVRAAAASTIPLISAVGHETDTTLIDFAADWRAPTPTAAAEKAVPVRLDMVARVAEGQTRMTRAMKQRLQVQGQRLRDLGRALPRPEDLMDAPRQRLDVASDRLPAALTRLVDRRRIRLGEAGALRPALLRGAIRAEETRLADRAARLAPALARLLAARRETLDSRAARLSPRTLAREAADARKRLDTLTQRLGTAQETRLNEARRALETLDRLRETLGYRETLRRGYAVLRDGETVVTTVAAAREAKALEVEFADGKLHLGGGAKKPARRTAPPKQGSLF
jgi:exodeoxyribonuclease VII large subunit